MSCEENQPFNPFYIGPHPSQACAPALSRPQQCSPACPDEKQVGSRSVGNNKPCTICGRVHDQMVAGFQMTFTSTMHKVCGSCGQALPVTSGNQGGNPCSFGAGTNASNLTDDCKKFPCYEKP